MSAAASRPLEGVFGGTFDPVHYGHLLLAEACRDELALDIVRFIPAAVPPHKQDRDRTDAKRRIEMLELAVGGNASFEVSATEIDRGGVSYTWQTLAEINDLEPSMQGLSDEALRAKTDEF